MQADSKDLYVKLKSGDVYMIEIQVPGCFATTNPLESLMFRCCIWLFTLAGERIPFKNFLVNNSHMCQDFT